ncbi:serine protease [Bradyrhizobium sp. S3.2.12]|uniref:trypsin-like serine peptidase n=1 Tax=Bradyrhizobium sp. S3.2.12 TaxID=3156387 RepID=UPI003399AD2B
MSDPILTANPYPFHIPLARELHLALTQLYPSAKAALFAGQKVGIESYMINSDQTPLLVWKDLLELAAKFGLAESLVQSAADDFPRSPRRPFFEALIAGQQPVTEREPRAEDGSPRFRHDDDNITVPEALLFHDDLSLPVGRIPWMIGALERMVLLAPAVCKLEVTDARGSSSGTGFRIGADLLLTNAHVLFPEGEEPTAITATFGYEDNGQGGGIAGTAVLCHVTGIKSNDDDDWGVVRVAQPLADTVPTILLSQAAVPVKNGNAFIIQHPNGQRKRLAYTRNRITYVSSHVVQYLTDTDVGSSGSPVFDDKGNLISLHHAGGRPQEVAGQPPLTKNEGIRIDRVLQGIRDAGIDI